MKEDRNYQPLDGSPDWFLKNILVEYEPILTTVEGRTVNMFTWNWSSSHLPTLLFVHGFGAHAHWWRFLAPFFTSDYRVAAIDLPGFGDSEAPVHYHDNVFANAIIECVKQNRLSPVTIVGHSFGGAQALRAMSIAPQYFKHGIIVDSNVRFEPEAPIRRLLPKKVHKYSTSREECIQRFKLMPPQPNYLNSLVHYIGFHSCTQSSNGWHWKADPACINVGEIQDADLLYNVSPPVDVIYGEDSFLNNNERPQKIFRFLPNSKNLIILPATGHHIMVEQPLLLTDTISRLLK